MLALEDVVDQPARLVRSEAVVDEPGTTNRFRRGRHGEQQVLGSGLDQQGTGRDQGTQVLVLDPTRACRT